MALCVGWGELVFPEKTGAAGLEAEARVLLSWQKNDKFCYAFESGKALSVPGRLLQLLSKIKNESLRDEIEAKLKKH